MDGAFLDETDRRHFYFRRGCAKLKERHGFVFEQALWYGWQNQGAFTPCWHRRMKKEEGTHTWDGAVGLRRG